MSAPTAKVAEPPSVWMKSVPSIMHALGLLGVGVGGVLVNDPSISASLGISAGFGGLLVAVFGSFVGQNNVAKAESAPPTPPPGEDGKPVDQITHYVAMAQMHASLNGDQALVHRLADAMCEPTGGGSTQVDKQQSGGKP